MDGELKPVINKSCVTDLEPSTCHLFPVLAYVTTTTDQSHSQLSSSTFCYSPPCYVISLIRYKIVIPSIVSSECLQWDGVYDWSHITAENSDGVHSVVSVYWSSQEFKMRTPWPENIKTNSCSQQPSFSLGLRKSMNQNNWDQAATARESLLGCSWLSSSLAVGRNGLQEEQRILVQILPVV